MYACGPNPLTSPATGAPARGRSLSIVPILAVALFAFAGLSAPAVAAGGKAEPTREGAPGAEAMIEEFVRTQFGPDYRVELRFGQLNPNIRLDACQRIEPFLAPGARLWGRTSIGVRCVEGANWSVSVPMTVAVFGPALVASRPIAPNTPLTAADVHVEEVELSQENRPALTDPEQVEGHVSTRSLRPGQALRDYHVRVMPTVRPGDPVRVRMIGQGFIVTADGAAMAAAGNGQAVRVRTPGGRVLVGTVNGRTVDVKL